MTGIYFSIVQNKSHLGLQNLYLPIGVETQQLTSVLYMMDNEQSGMGLGNTHDNSENRSEEHGSESAPEGVGDEGSNNRREAGHARIDVVHVCCGIWLHVVAAHQVTCEGRREGVGRHSSCREETCIASVHA